MNSTDYDRLMQACYQGPLEENLWATFLKELERVLSARFVTILLRPPKAGDQGVVLNSIVLSDDVFLTELCMRTINTIT